MQLPPQLFKPLRLSHAPLNTLDYIPDLVPGSFCAETAPVARAQVLKCVLDEARTLVDDRLGHIVEDLETRRDLVLLVRGHDLRRIHGEQKGSQARPDKGGQTCLHQHPHQDVEVMPEMLVFPGASAAGGPASHADCAAELDGELAELDDVAEAAECQSHFHGEGATAVQSVDGVGIVERLNVRWKRKRDEARF